MLTPDEIRSRLNALDEAHCALFAALVCDKLYPNYLLFTEVEQWGNPVTFRDGVEFLFDVSLTGTRSVAEAKEVDTAFSLAFPDLDDFSGITPGYAFDASCALSEVLEFVITGAKEHVVNCSTAGFDTIDMFVQEFYDLDPNRPDLNQIIDADPYMIRECARQRNILDVLSETTTITPALVAQFRMQQDTESGIVDINLLP